MKLTLLLTSLVALSTALPSAEPAPAPEAAAIAVADPVAVAEPGHSGRRRYSQARIHVHYGRSYRDYNYPVTGDWVRSSLDNVTKMSLRTRGRKCYVYYNSRRGRGTARIYYGRYLNFGGYAHVSAIKCY